MANEIMIPEVSSLPAYLKAMTGNAALLQATLDAAEGIGAGAPPTIVANQGMFKKKVDGVEEIIQMKVEGMGLINAPKIATVILKGKIALDRSYYASAYAGPSAEAQAPDCSSEDGIRPKADSPNKQCESCAGCPQNVFGTAKLQDGTPGKGKACGEKKRLAVYAAGGVYRFNVPPASLGDFAAYARQLAGHGLPLCAVITAISFDPETPTKLKFEFQGVVPEQVAGKILSLVDGDEVKAIMQEFTAPALAAPAAAAAQSGPSAAEVAAQKAAEEKAAADKKAAEKKAADEKKKAEKKAADEKKAAEAAAAATASAGAGLDLGLDLGMGGGAPDASAGLDPALTAGGAEMTDDDLAALFA